ncbi:hypothetical protein OPIT5_16675 [Opitutaceae bacterium TAV5]|nr:hypothetical protein OPIT5_16675 [Opitutaceae bacterium TAV5]
MIKKITSTVTAALKSGQFWAGFAAGIVVGVAYRGKIPAVITTNASKLPGASA